MKTPWGTAGGLLTGLDRPRVLRLPCSVGVFVRPGRVALPCASARPTIKHRLVPPPFPSPLSLVCFGGGGGRGLAGPSQTVWGAAALRLNRTHVEVLRWPRPPVSWTVPGRRPCQTPGPRLLPCARHVQRCLAKGAAGPPTLVMQYLFHWVRPSDLTL